MRERGERERGEKMEKSLRGVPTYIILCMLACYEARLPRVTHTHINHDSRPLNGGKGAVVHQRLNVPRGGAEEVSMTS